MEVELDGGRGGRLGLGSLARNLLGILDHLAGPSRGAGILLPLLLGVPAGYLIPFLLEELLVPQRPVLPLSCLVDIKLLVFFQP